MLTEFFDEHWCDAQGNPAGGVSCSTGICISWQNGPLGRDNTRRVPNGAFVETALAIAKSRIEFYQTASAGKFACAENAQAIEHINAALAILDQRTKDREARQVEGLHVR